MKIKNFHSFYLFIFLFSLIDRYCVIMLHDFWLIIIKWPVPCSVNTKPRVVHIFLFIPLSMSRPLHGLTSLFLSLLFHSSDRIFVSAIVYYIPGNLPSHYSHPLIYSFSYFSILQKLKTHFFWLSFFYVLKTHFCNIKE